MSIGVNLITGQTGVDGGAGNTSGKTLRVNHANDDPLVVALKAEDSAHVSGDKGFPSFGVRQDTPSALGSNGDYMPMSLDDLGSLRVALQTMLAGEMVQFNRMAGGPIVKYQDVTVDGAVSLGPCLYYGFRVITTGTSAIIYDSTSATGTEVFNGVTNVAASAADKMIPPSTVGVEMQAGLYVDLTGGGTLRIFYVDE